ncbi:hypothetical protein MNBD_NITROSPINAE01-645 [hydrothermal vent metagenome]|uniref:Uncharacterized protein n=1 Tax=hydrothermal vent metagenome TaxID=652676 RepID=A0A3B1C5U0_9ZZZZ
MEIDKILKNARKLKAPESLTAKLRKEIAVSRKVKPQTYRRRFIWPALAVAATLVIAIRLTPFAPPENIETAPDNLNDFIYETLGPVFSFEETQSREANYGRDLFLSEQLDILIANEGGNNA